MESRHRRDEVSHSVQLAHLRLTCEPSIHVLTTSSRFTSGKVAKSLVGPLMPLPRDLMRSIYFIIDVIAENTAVHTQQTKMCTINVNNVNAIHSDISIVSREGHLTCKIMLQYPPPNKNLSVACLENVMLIM